MKQEVALKHEFVEFIPDEFKEGTIYVSIRFGTASHLCCCGCGNKVVTPLRPTDWKLIFDGKTISLDPSIGNWSFACKSHYWIRNNRAKWAPRWSQEEIERGRSHDRSAKQTYFGVSEVAADSVLKVDAVRPEAGKLQRGFWQTSSVRLKSRRRSQPTHNKQDTESFAFFDLNCFCANWPPNRHSCPRCHCRQ